MITEARARPDLGVLTDAIRAAWSLETTISPGEWNSSTPSVGQCAVTSLVLQDYLGGELHRGLADGVSHYWLQTDADEVIDLTLDQFINPTLVETGIRDRAYLMSDSSTAHRYRVLAHNVLERLAGHATS